MSTATRSAIASASDWSCVTNSVVMPSASCSRRISSRSCTRTRASSAESGSSSSSTEGATASARASATRCCWPPESWCGYEPPRSPSPTSSSSSSRAPRAAPAAATLRMRSPNATFSAAVIVGNSEYAWNTIPVSRRLAGTSVTSRPSISTRPVGRPVEPGEQPQRGGLAAARRAEQREQLARLRAPGPARRARACRRSCAGCPGTRRRRCHLRETRRRPARAHHDSFRRAAATAPPANDTASSSTQVISRLASDSATATPARLRPTSTIATGNVSV